MTVADSSLVSVTPVEQSEYSLQRLLQKLSSLEKFQRMLRESKNLDEAMRVGLTEIIRLVGFGVGGFYMVSREGAFELTMVDPLPRKPLLQGVVAVEIERGTFAWALRQSQPILQRNNETNSRVVFSALTTPARILGMFVGLIEDEETRAAEDVQGLLALMLLGITYTIENYQLLAELRSYNDDLQEQVRRRTAEIVKANAEITKANAELQLELEVGRQRERELQVAKSQAEEAGKAKGEFLAVMSHEIRTPMSGVIGFASLLEFSGLNEEQMELVQQIHLSGEQLLNLLNDLLDFSKIEAGGMQLETQPIDVRELCWGLAKFIFTRASDKGVEVSFDIEDEVPTTILADPTRLRQIVTNLLGNALKFTAQGEIVLTVKNIPSGNGAGGQQLLWTVRDTGIGIPQDKINRLFKPFSQADSSTSRKYGGTGLGLAICLKLCDLMGGRIWVESEMGQGSQFKFTLPLVPGTAPAPASEVPQILVGVQVLVVSRNPHARNILLGQATRWGMEVRASSADLHEALHGEQISSCRVIIVDLQSSGLDVLELLDMIHGRVPDLVVLIFSANRADRERIEELKNPTVSCLLKPVQPTAVCSALARLLAPEAPKETGPSRPSDMLRMGQPKPQRPLCVLMVDDNPMNLTIGSQMLKSMGHDVYTVADGQSAIESISNGDFDLVIMDVNMPELDGLQTTKMIRAGQAGADKSGVFVAAWTALVSRESRNNCSEAGMDGFLVKPINLSELQRVVEICSSRKAKKA